MTPPRKPRPLSRSTLALLVSIGLILEACTGSSSPSSESTKPEAQAWARIDRELSALGPDVGFLAARVSPDGTCHEVHEVAPSTPRPIGSQFKLFVLGALADQIAAGQVSWDQTLTIQDAVKSVGNESQESSFEFVPSGTVVSVEEAATKMISISDNTAADMLIGLTGRSNVEAQVDEWTANASANEPFLTTRQMFLLHYVSGLADRYLATPRDQRAAFLASSVDPLPLGEIASGFSVEPRYVDEIEWFATPRDVCHAFAGLRELATDPSLTPLSTVLSQETALRDRARGSSPIGIGLDPTEWPTIWYKGGSEPGVLTLGWLATNRQGETFVVEAMVSNPDAVLAQDSLTDLAALAQDAFGLLGPTSD